MAILRPLVYDTTEGYPKEIDDTIDGINLGNGATIGGDLTFTAGEPKGLPTTPTTSDAAASKAYVDAIAVDGKAWKEILLVKQQLVGGGSGGVRQAILIAADSQPIANDTFIITDGTNTETYTWKATEAAAFDVAVGASAADALANLVQAINDDSSFWGAVDTVGLDPYFTGLYANQAVIYSLNAVVAAHRVYGTLNTATAIKVVEFETAIDADYSQDAGVEGDLPATDPGAVRFGFGRAFANLVTSQTHPIVETTGQCVWDVDDQVWRSVDVSAITAGAGLLRTGNVLDVELHTAATETGAGSSGGSSGLEFDTTGDAGLLRVSVAAAGAIGRLADGIGVRLPAATPGLAITGNELDLKADNTRGLNVDASGAFVAIDNSTLTFNGSGQIQVASAGQAEKLQITTAVSEAIAIGDVVDISGTADQVDKADASVIEKSFSIGVAVTAQSTVGQDVTYVSRGIAPGVLSGATPGDRYYLQPGGGIGTALASGPPGSERRNVLIGTAMNATDLFVDIQDWGCRRF